jgi:hypothetical protein
MIAMRSSYGGQWENVIRARADIRGNGLCPVVALCSADLRYIKEDIGCMVFFRNTHAYIVEYAKEILQV